MNDLVIQALQKQLNHERSNAQKYYYMAMGFDNMAYSGFAKLFKSQADGEMGHAQQIADMLIAKRITPEYHSVPAVVLDSSVEYYARTALQTELMTTEALKEVYRIAEQNDDPQVCAGILPMLNEQFEEENLAADFLDQVQRVDETGLEVLDLKYR